MLSIVVWILNKIDGVWTSWWILFYLEIFSWQAKGAKNQIPKILQFACSEKERQYIKYEADGKLPSTVQLY